MSNITHYLEDKIRVITALEEGSHSISELESIYKGIIPLDRSSLN